MRTPSSTSCAGCPGAWPESLFVDPNGAVDYDSSLDGFVSGQGTSTLKVTGLPITFDATALNIAKFNIDAGASGTNNNASQIVILNLLPGKYTFHAPASSDNLFEFFVNSDGNVSYDSSLEGYVSGQGSKILLVNEMP